MLSPREWNAALHPDQHWKAAYAVVEREVRSFLAGEWERLSTNDLVERLYPAAQARGEAGIAARVRLYKALATCAKHGLADCASKGKAKARFGKQVLPWEWHASSTPSVHKPKICPCCKRPL